MSGVDVNPWIDEEDDVMLATPTSGISGGGSRHAGIIKEGMEVDFAEQAETLIEVVYHLGDKKAVGTIVRMVRGEDKGLWPRNKASPLYGKGKERSVEFWKTLARQLISKGLLKETPRKMVKQNWTYLAISVTDAGSRFHISSEPFFLPQAAEVMMENSKPKVAVKTPR